LQQLKLVLSTEQAGSSVNTSDTCLEVLGSNVSHGPTIP